MKADAPCSKVRLEEEHPAHVWQGIRAPWKCSGYSLTTAPDGLIPVPTNNNFGARWLERVEWWHFQVQIELAQINDPEIRANTGLFLDYSSPTSTTSYWLAADGMSGFAITYDDQRGGGDLRYVFSRVRGRGDDIVRAALDRGATRLNCFENLSGFYARHGFVVEHTEPNYNGRGPNVTYMEREGR